MNPFQTDDRLHLVAQSVIVESSAFVDVKAMNIEILYPPKIDDFDNLCHISWRATVGKSPKIEERTWVGARMAWEENNLPDEKTFAMTIKRSAVFNFVIETIPAKPFIVQALDIYQRFNAIEDLTVAAFMNSVSFEIARSIDDLHKKLMGDVTYDPKKKPMIGLPTAYRVVSDKIKDASFELMKEIYNRFGEQRAIMIRDARARADDL